MYVRNYFNKFVKLTGALKRFCVYQNMTLKKGETITIVRFFKTKI